MLTASMLRSLLLTLLLLLGSASAPQLDLAPRDADGLHAAQRLAGAQLGTLDGGVAEVPAAAPGPPGPPPPPPSRLPVPSPTLPTPADFVVVVVQVRPPRSLSSARAVAGLDQRRAIRRLRSRAPTLETALSNA